MVWLLMFMHLKLFAVFFLYQRLDALVVLHNRSTCWKQPMCLSEFSRDSYRAEVLWQVLHCSLMTI